MKTKLIASVLAMAMIAGTPGFAADRPVGPETGQARTGADQVTSPGGPDDGVDFIPFPGEPGEIRAGGCPPGARGRICRWMQEWERNNGPIGF